MSTSYRCPIEEARRLGWGETTTYGYNVDGFQNEVVNPDGDYTQTGYDVRGNVSGKSCASPR